MRAYDKVIAPLAKGAHRQQLWQWSALGVFALALSGVFAILLLLSRTPFTSENIPWPEDFFQKGLVAHVALSFVVWFLAVLGALNTAMVPNSQRFSFINLSVLLDRLAILFSVAGTMAILIPAFSNQGEPSLNNYIPVIIDPIFYWGLGLLTLGIFISVIRVFINLSAITSSSIEELPVLMSAGLLYVAAIISTGLAGLQLQGQPVNYDYNESLFWGTGHILQFVNTALFLIATSLLYRRAFKSSLAVGAFFTCTSAILVLSGLMGLSFFSFYNVGSAEHTLAFTRLQYVLGVPVLMILSAVAAGLWRQRTNISWQDPACLSLTASVVVFSIGSLLGLFVDGQDTRTPAHYHGIIGGINLTFVGLFYVWFLPLLNRSVETGKILLAQIILYGGGQLLFVIGMFSSGGMGASRKTMGTEIDMESFSAIAATSIRDLGGSLAIIGGVLFIVIALKALFRHANTVP